MRRPLLVLLALALLLRLALVAASPGFEPRYDAADYDRIASSLASARAWPATTYATPGTPAAFRPPAWPLLLGATYEVTGARWTVGRVVGALLGTAAVGLLAALAFQLWGRRAALLTAGIAAVAPPLVVANASLLSEPLFIATALGAILAAIRADSARWLALAGALAGLATLTRTTGVVLVAVLALAAWPRAGWRGVVALVAAAALVASPWIARNLRAFDRPVLLGTQSGPTRAGAWNEVSRAAPAPYTGAWQVPTQLPGFVPAGDESVVDEQLGAAARAFAREHPGYVVRTAVTNLLRSEHLAGHGWLTRLSFDEMGVAERFHDPLALLRVLLLFGGLAGLGLLLVRRRAGPAWLWLVPAGFVVVTIPFAGNPRYGLATDPFLLLALAGGITALRSRTGTTGTSA